MRVGASTGPVIEDISDIPEEFDFVEIAIGEMEIAPEEIDREQLREDLERKDLGLMVHLPFRQPLVTGVEELDEANIDYHTRMISFSKELGAEKVVIHVDNRYGPDQEEKHTDELIEIMNRINEVGRRRDIEVTFENVPERSNPAVDLEKLAEIARENNLSLCLDLCHAYVEVEQEGVEEFIEQNKDVITHLHVQDSIKGEDSHVAVGHGAIDWEPIGDKLNDFEDTATIELFTEDMEYQRISREKFLEAVEN